MKVKVCISGLGFSCQLSASKTIWDTAAATLGGREAARETKAAFDGQLGQLETTEAASLDLFSWGQKTQEVR